MRATLAAATAVLLTVCVASACGGGVAASAPTASSAPASPAASVTPGATKSAGAVTAMSRFRLLALPASAEVAFLRDTVVWRVAPRDLSPTGPMPLIPVWRVDVTTGAMTRDAWLTSLLGGRRIDDWALARNKVAWVDSSARIELANGTVLVGAQVEVARRSSGTTQPLSRTSWGTLSKNGEYSPGAWLAGFDGRLCALRTRDLARASSGAATASGPRAGLWLVDTTLSWRHRLAPGVSSDVEVLAMTGNTAFWAEHQSPATNWGSRTVWWGSTSAQGGQAAPLEAPVLVSGPAVADRGTFAFTAVPPHATDTVDAHVWIYSFAGGTWRQLSGDPGGQEAAGVGDDFVVFTDGRRSTPGYPLLDLWGTDLGLTRRAFPIALSPATGRDPSNVTMRGNEVFWTLQGADRITVYGARLTRDRQTRTVRVRPL